MKSVALYLRVSSEKQVKEGDSIAAQREALRRYVTERPEWLIQGEYLDDGISGTSGDRSALNSLLEAVEADKVDIILFTKLDRWYRSIRHYTATQELLDRHGVSWLAIWEPIYDTTTPSGRLIVNQMMSIAQFEAENTGQRIRQVFDYKVRQGEVISGTAPRGYSIVDKRLVPNEDAPDVVTAFETYYRTGSLYETIRATEGTNMPRSTPGMKRLLSNEKYAGSFRGNDNYCPPLVSREIFDNVQRQLKMNVKSNNKRVYLFSGLIRCKDCGMVMAGLTRKKKRKSGKIVEYSMYRCVKHYQRAVKTCDNSKVIYDHHLESYMLSLLEGIGGFEIDETQEPPKKKDKKKARAAIRRKMNRLKDLYVNELIDMDTYRADLEHYQADLDALADEPEADMELLREVARMDVVDQYQFWDEETRRGFWRAIVKKIEFGKDRSLDIYFL